MKLNQIAKSDKYGKIVNMGEQEFAPVDSIPTGIVPLDEALGGGFPRGKMVEMFGPEGSGKTSIALHYLVRAQEHGKTVFIDLENSFNPIIAESIGIDFDKLYMVQPNSAEDAMEILEQVALAEDVSAVVVDSVAGLVSEAEINGDYGDSHVGVIPRLMSQSCRKISREMAKANSDTTVIWINQLREKIGGMPGMPNTTTTGGRALKFWSAVRLDVARTGPVKKGEDIIGHKIKVKVVKNKFSAPFKNATFEVVYETGISNTAPLVDKAIELGVLTKKGAWIIDTATGESLAQGRQNLIELLDNEEEMALYVKNLCDTAE